MNKWQDTVYRERSFNISRVKLFYEISDFDQCNKPSNLMLEKQYSTWVLQLTSPKSTFLGGVKNFDLGDNRLTYQSS